MVAVCGTCGNRGFDVALIYCDKCRTYAVHRYCLPKLPKTFDEEVVWFCSDCEPEVQRQSRPSVQPLENLEKDETEKRLLAVSGPCSNKEGKLIEAKTTSSKTSMQSSGSDWVNIVEGAESVNNRTSLTAINDHLKIIDNILDTGWRELDKVCSDEAVECVNTRTSTVATRNLRECSDEVVECVNIKASIVATSNQIRQSYVPARPIFEPIWWGSFRIYDENLTIGAIAHLSSLACVKVCETAECLPGFLRLDLLPRCNVWPKGFRESGPSEESIALYFFPNNEREIRTFDSILEKMVSQDLGMRAVLKDVELLVYTSNILPQHCWKFQGRFYLWGVFRAKQTSQSHVTNVVGGEDKNLVKASARDSRSPISPLSDTGSSRSC